MRHVRDRSIAQTFAGRSETNTLAHSHKTHCIHLLYYKYIYILTHPAPHQSCAINRADSTTNDVFDVTLQMHISLSGILINSLRFDLPSNHGFNLNRYRYVNRVSNDSHNRFSVRGSSFLLCKSRVKTIAGFPNRDDVDNVLTRTTSATKCARAERSPRR